MTSSILVRTKWGGSSWAATPQHRRKDCVLSKFFLRERKIGFNLFERFLVKLLVLTSSFKKRFSKITKLEMLPIPSLTGLIGQSGPILRTLLRSLFSNRTDFQDRWWITMLLGLSLIFGQKDKEDCEKMLEFWRRPFWRAFGKSFLGDFFTYPKLEYLINDLSTLEETLIYRRRWNFRLLGHQVTRYHC